VIRAGKTINPDLLVFYHSCGYVIPFLDELIEIGVDILNPVQPECMNFNEVYKAVGGRISFWGTLGTQSTLPFGTPAEVKEAVWANLRTCGKQGGIVIAPTHMVEPEVPWDNLLAMKEACETFRL
jgi:uroporphyrinogen decarboxylase